MIFDDFHKIEELRETGVRFLYSSFQGLGQELMWKGFGFFLCRISIRCYVLPNEFEWDSSAREPYKINLLRLKQ